MSHLHCFLRRVLLFLILTAVVLSSSAVALGSISDTIIMTSVSEVEVIADSSVSAVGFTVNGDPYSGPVYAVSGENILILLNQYQNGRELYMYLVGNAAPYLSYHSVLLTGISGTHLTLYLSFEEITEPFDPDTPSTDDPTQPDGPDTPDVPDTPSPSEPVRPDVPDTPGTPDTPGADTPGSDEPGSDKPGSDEPGLDEPGLDEPGSDGPFVPILPPAGSVYNIAGSIPLAAGALLLFLLVFWRRKVYRLLKHHAKQHGEKPDKQQLKATAAAVVALLQNKELYPEWRKNKETLARLLADIERALDETQYPQSIPREPVVTDIIKAAKGRINRYRL